MPQTSLYMDNNTMELIRTESKRQGVSLSRFIAGAVSNYTNHITEGWPSGYWERVCGCLSDISTKEAKMLFNTRNSECLDPSLDDDCSWFE